MEKCRKFQLVVIGGGSAGHAAAMEAAGAGISAALVERSPVLGGLCILRGCMPSKILIETANRMREIRRSESFAIRCGAPELDLEALQNRVAELTEEFRSYRQGAMTAGDYELIRSEARFRSPAVLEVGGELLEASCFIVATGSSPVVPKIPGLAGTPFWTSDDVVRLPSVPRRLLVIGSGAIGMECAHLFEGLGSKVSVLARGSEIMSSMDPDIAAELETEGAERGIVIRRNSPVERVEYDDGVFHLRTGGKVRDHEADALLIATGRAPATSGLGLEQTGVSMHEGRILIDDEAATSVPGFFAAGDCASPAPVVHLAVAQGIVAARNAVRMLRSDRRGRPARWNPGSTMSAWFTEPQCVQVGLPECEAPERGIAVVVGRQDIADHGKGMIAGARHGFVKVLVDRSNGRILGAAGVGPQVVETAHLLQAAIELGLTTSQYLAIPHYHPTFAEAWSRAVEEAAAACPAPAPQKQAGARPAMRS